MIIPKDAPLVYISFSGGINQKTTEQFLNALMHCVTVNVQKIYILFSCPGGSVINGFNIYNVLSGLPMETIIHNVSRVDSIGTLIFLGAKRRIATSNSTFMFHGVGHQAQNQSIEEKRLRDMLNVILKDQKKLSDEYIKRTTLTEDEITEFFREGITINAEKALSKEIVHEIADVEITNGCPVITILSH